MIYEYGEPRWNDIDSEKPKNSEKGCSSATLSTTNLTYTDPGANPGLRGDRPATNSLTHGTALSDHWSYIMLEAICAQYCFVATQPLNLQSDHYEAPLQR
jgi:hypothetical protein